LKDLANKVLLLVAQTADKNLVVNLGFWPTRTASADFLKDIIKDVSNRFYAFNIYVCAYAADNLSTNASCMKFLAENYLAQTFFGIIVTDLRRLIAPAHDPEHLIKTLVQPLRNGGSYSYRGQEIGFAH
jgi:hypothetical protein